MLDTHTNRIVQYKSNSGIQAGEFNQGSGFLSSHGFLVFGGINGMNIFYPDKAIDRKSPEKLHLTDFKLNNESVMVSNDTITTPLNKSISIVEKVNLAYDQNDISIDYAALQYPFNQSVNYAYMLEGVDNNWNFVGNSTTATYRNLAPGDYIFKVKIVDDQGKLSHTSAGVKLNISPPIWLSWPAILIYIALSLSLVYLAISYYTDQVKLKNSLFYEKRLRQKETALNQERFRFFTSFSHELRTPLTLILGPGNRFDQIREKPTKSGKVINDQAKFESAS